MFQLCKAAAYMGLECQFESNHGLKDAFGQHIAKYGISYGTEAEFEFRYAIFAEKDAEIKAHNSENGSFQMGHNKFSTYSREEYRRMLGRLPNKNKSSSKVVELPTDNLSDSVDWRTKGAVNAVQDQGQCGSCWAFSATASIESAHFLKTGNLLKLAEQQLVDCSAQQGNEGCNGGLEVWAFEYAEKQGLELESAYPYTATDGSCKYSKAKAQVEVTEYAEVPKKSVAQLKAAIDVQPTCVSVEADTSAFQLYTSGILDTTKCGTNLDHAITAVGYGTENGKEFVIVRNSWGADWGENGYIRIAITKDGAGVCGVLLDSSRPTTN